MSGVHGIDGEATVETLCRRHGVDGAVLFCAHRANALVDQNNMVGARVWLSIMTKIEKIQRRIWAENC